MFVPEHHLLVCVEHLEYVCVVVLAAKAYQHALPFEGQDLLLHIPENVAWVVVGVELDAIQSVLSHDAAPQRVVAVEHKDLVERAAKTAGDEADLACELVEEGERVRCLAAVVEARIETLARTQRSNDASRINQPDVWPTLCLLAKCSIELGKGIDLHGATVEPRRGMPQVCAGQHHGAYALGLSQRQIQSREIVIHRRLPRGGVQRVELAFERGLQIVEEGNDKHDVHTLSCEALYIPQEVVVVALDHIQAHARQVGMASQRVDRQVHRDVCGDPELQTSEPFLASIELLEGIKHLDHRRISPAQDIQRGFHHDIEPPPFTRRL